MGWREEEKGLKRISVKLPRRYLDEMDELIEKGLASSWTQLIRDAVYDLLVKEGVDVRLKHDPSKFFLIKRGVLDEEGVL